MLHNIVHFPHLTCELVRHNLQEELPGLSTCVMAAVVLVLFLTATAFSQTGIITGDRVNLRPDPSTQQQGIAVLSTGTEVSILESNPSPTGFYHVKTSNGQEGWVKAEYVQITDARQVQPIGTSAIIWIVIVALAILFFFARRSSTEHRDDMTESGLRPDNEISTSALIEKWERGEISDREAVVGMARKEGTTVFVLGSTGSLRDSEPTDIAGASDRQSNGQYTLPGMVQGASTNSESVQQDHKQLVEELIQIGCRPQPSSGASWYLTRANTRAREIGNDLQERGGMDLMLQAHSAVVAALGGVAGRELEVAWNGIGDWQG